MTYLGAGDITKGLFLDLLGRKGFGEGALIMAFSPAAFRFQWYRFDRNFLAAAEQGRIFSERGEFKWRRVADIIRCVYLGEGPIPEPLEDRSDKLVGLGSRTIQRILWGVRTDSEREWLEQQVPQRFDYPVEGKIKRGRVLLEVEEWFDNLSQTRFSRYRGLKEMKGGPDA